MNLKSHLLSFASIPVILMALAAISDAKAQTLSPTSTSTSTSSSAAGAQSSSNSGAAARGGNSNSSITYNTAPQPSQVQTTDRVVYSGDQTVRTAPTVYVPNVVTGNVCALGASAGASWLGAGFGVAGSWESQQCERRQQAALLHNAGYKQASRELMCDQREIYDAMKRGGTPCLPRPAWDGPSAPPPVVVAPVPAPAPMPMVQQAPAPQPKQYPRCDARRGIVDNCAS